MSTQQFTPGDLGFEIAEMIGGPFDGARYKDIPVLPGPEMPSFLSLPLGGADAPHGRAGYKRRPQKDAPCWRYDYVGTKPPSAPHAEAEAPVRTTLKA
ncbi:hypothetical protein GXB85_08480 [Cellulomonas sp. APG4]|uniref:hypothetical protein n=1 Tax=Cellulomonas sp. APG4 TaxID=1538656 RepID=UPI00137985F2|nr:hypothetical protein [Cellulomonas sp. APG4]NCT90980.1 hypothetical protein [Cellulomonas sp. APG4]